MTESCNHLEQIREVTPSGNGCVECLQTGGSWLKLRMCMTCGHVGCCDDSSGTHATKHYNATGHPIMRSFEPGESWGWCYPEALDLDASAWPVRGPVAHTT